jgi:hypothetical protein
MVLKFGLQLTLQFKGIFCFSFGSEIETRTHSMVIMIIIMPIIIILTKMLPIAIYECLKIALKRLCSPGLYIFSIR